MGHTVSMVGEHFLRHRSYTKFLVREELQAASGAKMKEKRALTSALPIPDHGPHRRQSGLKGERAKFSSRASEEHEKQAQPVPERIIFVIFIIPAIELYIKLHILH